LKAKNYLFQAIARSILETIIVRDTAKRYMGFYAPEISRIHKGEESSTSSSEERF
jgi:hypothetical protein